MNKYELTILAPAYNEEKNITLFLKEFIPKIPDNWSILIINDGSEDSTEKEINKNFNPVDDSMKPYRFKKP